MAKFSTGLRNAMLANSSLASALATGLVKIYAGTPPASADAALGAATLLCTVSTNSTGTALAFETAAVNGVLSKKAADVWSGVNAATGSAAFFRHSPSTDDGSLSTTIPRIQGTVALAGGDINISSLGLTSGATQTINSYNVALPTL